MRRSILILAMAGALAGTATACNPDAPKTPKITDQAASRTAKPTLNPSDYTVVPAQHKSSFVVQTKNGAYRVTLAHGKLIKPQRNLSAVSAPSNVEYGNGLGTPLGSGCRVISRIDNRVVPFSISVTGIKGSTSPVAVKFMSYEKGRQTPEGSVRMEFTQSSNRAMCYDLNTGTDVNKARGLTFSVVRPKMTTTLTGWFILGGNHPLIHHKLALTSISPTAGGTARSLTGDFTPFKVKGTKLTGGKMPILPVMHNHS